MIKLVLVGCGNMGYAMLVGWVKSGKLDPASVFVVEPNAQLRARAEDLRCQTAAFPEAIAPDALPDLIVIAVKPQAIAEVLTDYARFGNTQTSFLSVVAGVTIATLQSLVGKSTPIIRCMPNTPAAIGKGMLVTCSNAHVTDLTEHLVSELLSVSGKVATVMDEDLLDAVTAVSGSGPAYIFHFIEALAAAGEQAGLPPDIARLLALQTTYGAAALASYSGEDPGTLRQQVTSPNGTTAAALAVLMGDNRLKTLLTEAVEAARQRSVELRTLRS